MGIFGFLFLLSTLALFGIKDSTKLTETGETVTAEG
jgi:hypothetical protein